MNRVADRRSGGLARLYVATTYINGDVISLLQCTIFVWSPPMLVIATYASDPDVLFSLSTFAVCLLLVVIQCMTLLMMVDSDVFWYEMDCLLAAFGLSARITLRIQQGVFHKQDRQPSLSFITCLHAVLTTILRSFFLLSSSPFSLGGLACPRPSRMQLVALSPSPWSSSSLLAYNSSS